MAYLGNSPVLSQQEYRNIDDISGSFNGSTTSFPLLVNGVAPIPGPQTSNQCLISVNGVIQKPDDTGASGFRISGGNIVFSSAPTGGQTFFGVILAGADYIYAGENFPDGTVSAPTITFAQDLDTGFYRSGAGEVKFTANGVNTVTFSSNGLTAPNFIPSGSAVPTNGIYLPSANNVAIATNSTQRLLIDSAGQIEAVSLGSAAAPTWSFTTDPNTGIYSPGADQVAISTNGTRRFQVGSDGTINVFGANKTPSGGGNSVVYSTDTQAVDVGGSIAFGGYYIGTSSDTEWAQIAGRKENSTSGNYAGYLQFSTRANGGSTTERLRITSAGLVGVGTSSPSYLLEVRQDSAGVPVGINMVDTNASGRSYSIRSDGGQLRFRDVTGSADRVTLDSSGRLGIGTSSPSARLDIAADSGDHMRFIGRGATDYSDIVFYSSANTTRLGYIDFANTQARINVEANVPFRLYTNAQERLTVTAAGNVGIGTTSPGTRLEVSGADGEFIRINTTTSAGGYMAFRTNTVNMGFIGAGDQLGGGTATDLNVRSQNSLTFCTNGGNERARIDSSGRLLVGTSSSVDSTSQIQNYATSGQLKILNRSDSLANGNVSSLQALGYANPGQPRYGELAVYKHSGITNACGFLGLSSEDAAFNYLWTDNSDVLRISTNDTYIGTTSGTVVGTQTSDERLKNILGPVEYGLETLMQIEPVRFSLKSEPNTEKLGFIAQQVLPLVPQSVFDTKEHIEGEPEDAPTKLGMEYVALIPVLVNAIKELSAEVDALKAQLQAP